MNIQKVTTNTLGALKKAKAQELKLRQKREAEERLEQHIKTVAKTLLPNIRFRARLNRSMNDSFSASAYIQKMNGDLFRKDSILAPWVNTK